MLLLKLGGENMQISLLKTYIMQFPKLEFMKLAKNIEKEARDYLQLDEHAPLQVEHVLSAYNKLSVVE